MSINSAQVGPRILVVDDNSGTVTATTKYLELSGFNARGVQCGLEAVKMALLWKPEWVFLDLGLPDIDGFEVLRRVRSALDPAAVTFVAVSGRDDEATRARVQEAGFSRCLVKPIPLTVFSEIISEHRPS